MGIVNAKSGGSDVEGIGFAVPINTAMEVAEQLIANGYVSGRPAMGIQVVAITDLQTAMQAGVSQLGVYAVSYTHLPRAPCAKCLQRALIMSAKPTGPAGGFDLASFSETPPAGRGE